MHRGPVPPGAPILAVGQAVGGIHRHLLKVPQDAAADHHRQGAAGHLQHRLYRVLQGLVHGLAVQYHIPAVADVENLVVDLIGIDLLAPLRPFHQLPQVGDIAVHIPRVADELLQIRESHRLPGVGDILAGLVIFAGDVIGFRVGSDVRPGKLRIGLFVLLLLGIDVLLEVGQSHQGGLFLLHGGLQPAEHVQQCLHLVGGHLQIRRVFTRIPMVAVALFVDLGLQVGAQGVAQTADILGAGDAVHVVLVDLRMGGHHRLVLHLVCAGRFPGGLSLIGGDGAYTVVLVSIGGHEDLVVLAVLGVDVPAVQLGDAAILAVHGAPEGVGGQRGGVQLGRAQGQVGDAVGGVIEVDEVAPADIGRGEGLVKGGGLVDVRVLRGLAPVQGDLQRAVG